MSEALRFVRPDWHAPARVHALVTERSGGVSTGAYASLNLGARSGDAETAVAENRRRLREAAGLPAEPVWLRQVHGTDVAELDPFLAEIEADAAVTGTPGVVCAVLTADCLPVFLTARDGTRVGVAHAGWRGLAAGVVERAVERLRVPPAELVAWLGPAIGPAAFEVGDDVVAAFRGAGFETEQAIVPNAPGRWQADLYALATQSLVRAGLRDVYGGGFCTYAEPARFYSHRRDGPCGRLASLIWID